VTWEYQTVKLEFKKSLSQIGLDPKALNRVLTEQGTLGWELVSTATIQMFGITQEVTLIFKRPRE